MTLVENLIAIGLIGGGVLLAPPQRSSAGNPAQGGPALSACCVCEPYIDSHGNLAMGCPCNRQSGGTGCIIMGLSCSTTGSCPN